LRARVFLFRGIQGNSAPPLGAPSLTNGAPGSASRRGAPEAGALKWPWSVFGALFERDHGPNPSENPCFFAKEIVPWDNLAPRKNSYFSAFSVRFFRRGFTTCAEPPRASHLPALQNSPFADLLACVDLSKVEMESVGFLWDALKQGFGLAKKRAAVAPGSPMAEQRRRTSPEVRKSEVRKSEVRKSEVRKWSMLSKVLNRDRRSFFLCVSLSFCLLSF
jgi:hypothetical protein